MLIPYGKKCLSLFGFFRRGGLLFMPYGQTLFQEIHF